MSTLSACRRHIGAGTWTYTEMWPDSRWTQETGTVHRWLWYCDECSRPEGTEGHRSARADR